MGKSKTKEMLFWTLDEYTQFSEAMKKKPVSYYAFQILYWTGIRCGELLALTKADFDFERKVMKVTKNYQVVKGQALITTPKTEKSIRQIDLPDLRYYKTEEGYFENHRYFQLITESGAYRYEIFAYKDVGTLTGGIYTTWNYVDDDFKDFVENTICQGGYVDADIDIEDETHIVTLSTCSYDSDVRFTVSAVRVDEHMWNQ